MPAAPGTTYSNSFTLHLLVKFKVQSYKYASYTKRSLLTSQAPSLSTSATF